MEGPRTSPVGDCLIRKWMPLRLPNREADTTRCHCLIIPSSDNKGATDGIMHINTLYLVALKNHLTSPPISTLISWTLSSSDGKTVILETTSSKHIKLIDRISDPPASPPNQTLPEKPSASPSKPIVSQPTPSRPNNMCFICVHVHGFLTCIPIFCKKSKSIKPKQRLPQKLRLR